MRSFSLHITVLALAVASTACGGSDDTVQIKSDATSSGTGSDSSSNGTGGFGTGGGGPGAGGSGASSGPTGSVGPTVISTSAATDLEAETHVAVAPSGLVAVAYIGISQGGFSTNGYRFSKNWGNDWEAPATLDSPDGRVASDPVLAVDSKQNFYMTWIGYQIGSGGAFDMHVYVAMAPAGTTTFGNPIEVTDTGDSGYDKPWIAITNKDALILTYARTSTGAIFAARSTDQGQTWKNALIVEDGGFRNLVYPCPPATGDRVYATYHAGGGIGLRWSDDDGATWPDANKVAVAQMDEQPAFDDPTCASEGQEVWVTYGLSNDPFGTGSSAKLTNVRFAHTSDGGTTIDYHGNAHDDAAATYFMHPQLVREPMGTFDLVYYAGNADNDTNGSYRRSRSSDGGKTWEASTPVQAPLTYLQARDSPKWVGDYTGLTWFSGSIFTSYVDNTGQVAHVAFYRTAVP